VAVDTDPKTNVNSFDAVANIDPSSGHEGDIEFCVRTNLKDAYSGETMVYRSEQIKVTFDYDGAFTVTGFATTPFAGIGTDNTTGTATFGVTAAVCDQAGAPITSPPALSLGTNLFVCFESKTGTNIPSFNSFSAQKAGEPLYNIAAPANPNVIIRGFGSSNVKVVMNLPARFFSDATPIILSGSVALVSDSRRHLASSRALEVDSDKADFGLVVQVIDSVDDPSFSASKRVMTMCNAIFGVAAFLFF